MENLKHTPGPWKIKGYAGEHDEDGALIAAGDKNICSTSGGLRENSSPKEWGEYYANANLIAIAPDMLEAMIEFCDRVDRGEVKSTKTYNKFKELIKRVNS